MSIVDAPRPTRLTPIRRRDDWRIWNLVVLGSLSAYSTGIGWQAQLVSYPLYRNVPPDAFADYHEAYNRAIPFVVIVPGFLTFLAGIAFYWTKPKELPRALGLVVSVAGAIALGTTVLWAIPKHDELDRIGLSESTIDSLLTANLVRSIALTVSAVALAWGVRALIDGRRANGSVTAREPA